ncbi:unnamed protein product [Prorocentrum cordatum]|uniref:ATP-grasp domain-containing protein n=1 Tax=Prorocentrum cordatum TaxID=2364126 RepID=A0ABN9VNA2_9DINO|nr:unnamed protein product [Polarella glacialis]
MQADELRAPLRARLRAAPPWRGPEPDEERFHLVPRVGWNQCLRGLRCGARTNTLTWRGHGAPPAPPAGPACLLLPASDAAAVEIARQQDGLRALGWRVVSSSPETISRLGDKARLRGLAEELGLLAFLPVHYASPGEAEYPCILKSASGEFGKDCHISAGPPRRTGGSAVP